MDCNKRTRGLCGRSATSIVAACSRSFRLRRFASPLEKQSRLWRPVNSNQRFEYDRLVRGCFMRHWRESAHLPLHPFGRILYKGNGYCKKKYLPCIKDLLHPKGRRRVPRGDGQAPWNKQSRNEIVNPKPFMPEGVKGVTVKPPCENRRSATCAVNAAAIRRIASLHD